MVSELIVLRCVNVSCRIETFTGTYMPPLNTCPICQFICLKAS